MQKPGLHFDDLAETFLAYETQQLLRARIEGELGGAAHPRLWMRLYLGQNALVSDKVNAERFLAQQVFSGLNDVHVQFFMQVVRHGAVDGLNVVGVEQVVTVCGGYMNAVEIVCKPVEHGGVAIADAYDARHDIQVEQVAPASRRAAKFAPHQAAADHAKVDDTLLHRSGPQ